MTHYELLTVVASYLAQPIPVLRQGTNYTADLRSRIVGKIINKGKQSIFFLSKLMLLSGQSMK